ncbi:hypothetical protein N7452_010981, partial [Penicillium brevicompactum]
MFDSLELISGSLKLIHSVFSGLDHFLAFPIVEETDIPLTNSSGIHGPPIAEWTIMKWLVASRKYQKMHDDQENHEWNDRCPYMTGIHDQVGKKVGGMSGVKGQVVDQEALSAALKLGQIAFAALDVTDPEPLTPDHYLWDVSNKQISPH